MDDETERPSTPSQQIEKGSPKEATPQPTLNFDDWNGPDDPDNPHNWSAWSRFYHALGPALLGFAGTFGTSVYSPAVSDVMRDFDVSRTAALVCLTVYTLGLGVGPIATAPLSEGHGRKIIYTVSTPIFLLFILGAGLSKSYHSLVICRFLAGVSASPPLAVGAGTNADLFPPRTRAVATSMFLAAPFLGPAIGPVIGGFAAQYKSWKWTQWCMIFVTLTAYAIALPMKETYKPVILAKRAKKAGMTPPPATANVKTAIALKVVRPVHMLFREPAVFFFSIYNSFAFGVLFIFFAAFPYIFSHPPYSFTLSQGGLTFISIGIGVLLGAATCIAIDRTMYQKQHHKALARGETYTPPEYRLYSGMVGSWGIVVGLFWFGWGADKGGHWSWVLVGAIPFAWGNVCLFTSTALYLVDVYGPLNGASAMAANGLSRYTISAVFPLFTVQMYEALGIGWATSLLAFLATLLLPIPWIFFKYGPKIRAKSKYPPMK
ncbi:major facilitator superfamily domain-containing protein [Paraphoma chrysanthemicola]|uniref:Major facilitator superfamily domain-containing protein n=1 Tax=Paraphoma chrysanthemicola TaxID=798071 RepID=A0A8K0RHG6_9PLEO|nr:major facilitator superfamily domain-containing protein [Paraphoma chrysanthemicola]